MHKPLMHSIQFTGPHPDISKVPTHAQTNDRPAQLSRQTPLQYQDVVSVGVTERLGWYHPPTQAL